MLVIDVSVRGHSSGHIPAIVGCARALPIRAVALHWALNRTPSTDRVLPLPIAQDLLDHAHSGPISLSRSRTDLVWLRRLTVSVEVGGDVRATQYDL